MRLPFLLTALAVTIGAPCPVAAQSPVPFDSSEVRPGPVEVQSSDDSVVVSLGTGKLLRRERPAWLWPWVGWAGHGPPTSPPEPPKDSELKPLPRPDESVNWTAAESLIRSN
jgi:hypothetical protein